MKLLWTIIITALLVGNGFAQSRPPIRPIGPVAATEITASGDVTITNTSSTALLLEQDDGTDIVTIGTDETALYHLDINAPNQVNTLLRLKLGTPTGDLDLNLHHCILCGITENISGDSLSGTHVTSERNGDSSNAWNYGGYFLYHHIAGTGNVTANNTASGLKGQFTGSNNLSAVPVSGIAGSDKFNFATAIFSNGDEINVTNADANCAYAIDTDYTACEVSGVGIILDTDNNCGDGDCTSCQSPVDVQAGCSPTATFFQPPVRAGQYATGVSAQINTTGSDTYIDNASALFAEDCSTTAGTILECAGLTIENQSGGNSNFGIVLNSGADGIFFNGTSGTSITGDATDITINGNLISTGTISGSVPVVNTTDATLAMTVAQTRGTVHTTDDDIITYTLPVGANGLNACWHSLSNTSVITIDPNGSEVMVLAGTAASAGEAIVSSGAVGEFICFFHNGTNWYSMGTGGTWAEATP